MKARAALAKAPIRVMSPSRSGIPNASPASRREGGERERVVCVLKRWILNKSKNTSYYIAMYIPMMINTRAGTGQERVLCVLK